MTALEVLNCEPVNGVDAAKVTEIFNSIVTDGWHGAPILVYGNCLLTGSHRQAALQKMYDEGLDLDFECAADVTDIIEDKIDAGMTGQDIFESLDYLRAIFAGTWVEEYKDQITEW